MSALRATMPAPHEPHDEMSPGAVPRADVRAYSAPARVAAVILQALAALNIVYLAANILFDITHGTQTAPPLAVALGLIFFSGVPWAAAMILERGLGGTVEMKDDTVVLSTRRARFEVPLASVVAVRPLWLPLPGPGVALAMKSGRRFRYRLGAADPSRLLSLLSGALPSAKAALGHPAIAYARARDTLARRRWYFWLIKFGLIPLAIAIILFRLHQYIVYGGPFGEYHWYGLAAYLKSFALRWAGTLGGLVVYAVVARLAVEPLALLVTFALPSRARLVRRLAEGLCHAAYFGLIPAYVLVRLLL